MKSVVASKEAEKRKESVFFLTAPSGMNGTFMDRRNLHESANKILRELAKGNLRKCCESNASTPRGPYANNVTS